MTGPFSKRHSVPKHMNRATISFVMRALTTPNRDIKIAALYTFCIFQGFTVFASCKV